MMIILFNPLQRTTVPSKKHWKKSKNNITLSNSKLVKSCKFNPS